MKHILVIGLFLMTLSSYCQNKNYLSFSFTDNASSYPFQILYGYTENPIHPGFEAAWGKNFSEKGKHSWFREFKIGYFYHQYIQHGIPLYINYGYRYHFSKHFKSDIALGAGYLHSIPATEVMKADEEGNYENSKGIGRPQFMAALTIGSGYSFKLNKEKDITVFFQYQARVQAPYVKSYIPFLPYNQIALGAAIPITVKSK